LDTVSVANVSTVVGAVCDAQPSAVEMDSWDLTSLDYVPEGDVAADFADFMSDLAI
jgi:hypothetical protein